MAPVSVPISSVPGKALVQQILHDIGRISQRMWHFVVKIHSFTLCRELAKGYLVCP